jgi:two-component system phosphate regulon sensor histidine kinase PhoR
MSRTILWIITIFLSLAMVAMVGIQVYWIKHSMEAEENQLDLLVHQVLSEISDELIRNETMITILDEIRPPLIQQQTQAVWDFHIDSRSAYDASEPEEVQAELEAYYEEAEEIHGESDLIHVESDRIHVESEDPHVTVEEQVYIYTSPHHSLKNQTVELINDSVLVILGEDELMQDTILVSAMKPDQVRMELKKRLEEQEAFVDRIVQNMLFDEGEISDRISGSQVQSLLKEKLSGRGLDMDFEYAVYEEGKKPIFQSENFNEYEACSYFRASLFPGRVFNKTTLISLYFPTEREHLRKSMGVIGGSSLIITMFIIAMFTLALYIIFKQKRLSEIKNDFVNNMTHELKTPISTISLASQMLNDRSIPEEQKNIGQISRIIQTESRQLGFQVERVLQMAIFDHGELKLKQEEIDLHDIIETVAQNFLLQIDKREGMLEFLPEADNTVIQGDLMHITNVISNLLENAMKYTRNTPEIRIATRNEDESVIVSVVDNGIGIGKEDQKRIFDKFYRVPTGNIHSVKGFGLGLSYVKLIVEQHQGSITLKSEPNKGSQFDIHLPLG